jgi:hypothetical protein
VDKNESQSAWDLLSDTVMWYRNVVCDLLSYERDEDNALQKIKEHFGHCAVFHQSNMKYADLQSSHCVYRCCINSSNI